MATKKNHDVFHLYVVSDVQISEKAWRNWCVTNNIPLDGVNVQAHAANEIKRIVREVLGARGVLVE